MPEPAATDQRRADLGRDARDPRQINLGPQARGQIRPPDRRPPAEPQGRSKGDGEEHSPGGGDEDSGPAQESTSGADAGKDEGDKDEGDDKHRPKKPSPLKKPWVRLALAVFLLIVIAAGAIWFYRYWTHGRFVESTNNAYLQADQVTVSAKVSGTVEEVFVTDNQQVHVGDPLVRIDDRTSREREAQALAQAAQGRSAVQQYEAQIAEQQATVAQSVAAVQGAEVQRRFSQSEVDRYEPLARSGSEPAERLAQMAANRDQAAANLRQSQAQSLQARRRIATLRSQIGTAEAQVAQAQALARQARIDVESSLIRASIDGRIGDRQARVGIEAQIGTRLMTIVPVQSIYLVANFKETQIGLMRIGQPATVKVDALDGMALQGTVESFSPATGASFALIPPNNATGNFTKIVQRVPVRIRVDAGEEARKVLVPGLSVEVSVDTLGSKGFVDDRKDEASRTKAQRREESASQVDRDRQSPASGPGR